MLLIWVNIDSQSCPCHLNPFFFLPMSHLMLLPHTVCWDITPCGWHHTWHCHLCMQHLKLLSPPPFSTYNPIGVPTHPIMVPRHRQLPSPPIPFSSSPHSLHGVNYLVCQMLWVLHHPSCIHGPLPLLCLLIHPFCSPSPHEPSVSVEDVPGNALHVLIMSNSILHRSPLLMDHATYTMLMMPMALSQFQ